MKTKTGKLLTSKRTWSSIINFVLAVGVPAAMVAAPGYAVPIGSGAAAMNGIAGALSGKSKLNSNKVAQDAIATIQATEAIKDAKNADAKTKRRTKTQKVASNG